MGYYKINIGFSLHIKFNLHIFVVDKAEKEMIFTKSELIEKGFSEYREGGVQYLGFNLDKNTSMSSWLVTSDSDEFDPDPQFVVQLCIGIKPIVPKFLNSAEIDLVVKALSC